MLTGNTASKLAAVHLSALANLVIHGLISSETLRIHPSRIHTIHVNINVCLIHLFTEITNLHRRRTENSKHLTGNDVRQSVRLACPCHAPLCPRGGAARAMPLSVHVVALETPFPVKSGRGRHGQNVNNLVANR